MPEYVAPTVVVGTTTAAPKPISDALQKFLDATLSKIETGKRGTVYGAVTTTGAEVGVGYRAHGMTVSGYAGREWGGSWWLAGARAGFSW